MPFDPNDPDSWTTELYPVDPMQPQPRQSTSFTRNGWGQTPIASSDGTQQLGDGTGGLPVNWSQVGSKVGGQVSTPQISQAQQTLNDYTSWADYFQNQGLGSINTNLSPYQTALNQGTQQDAATRNQLLQNQANAFNAATASNAGIYQGMDAARGGIDSNANAILGNYYDTLRGANALDAGNVAYLQNLNGQMRQLQAGGYGPDVTSDPNYVGMQMGAYNNFGNWASGANNISSDAGLVGQQQGIANAFGGWASGANDVYSDAGLVGMQQGVYDSYGGWASGANDIYSDAGLVGQQQGVFGAYGDWASGANDVYSDAALVGAQQNVLSGYGDWSSGAYDLQSEAAGAQADAESLAAQKDALGQFKERSDPRLTDAERFLYLQNRMQQEQTMRGVRDANMRELQRQGMSGSTMALSNLNSSSQETANMRQLGDLGANAAAIQRADRNLGNYANLSSTIADQSFGRDFATRSAADRMAALNNQQRFAGLQGEGQMATVMRNADDQLRQGNQQMRFAGLQGQGTQANVMRSQDDALRSQNQQMRFAGTQGQGTQANVMRAADDNMRQFNSGQRLTGLQSQGQMVTGMRNADDSMRQFNSGQMLAAAGMQGDMANEIRSADDALRTFNKSQSMIQQRFQDQFAADQQAQSWGRGVDVSNAGFRRSENLARNATTGWEAGNRTLTGQWDRYADQANTGVSMNRDYMNGQNAMTQTGMDAVRDNRNSFVQGANFALGTEGIRQGVMNSSNAVRMQGVQESGEDRRAQAALDQAAAENERRRKAEEKQGIIGNIFTAIKMTKPLG